jgi:hypothetical protein
MPYCVYKIWSLKGDKVYYGSHTRDRPAIQRYYKHTSEYKSKTLKCMSKVLFEEYGIKHCLFQIVEDCDSIQHAREREKWFIQNNSCVNKTIPVPTEDEIKESRKQYRLSHKEDKKAYDVKYREKNSSRNEKIKCNCGGSYVKRHKTTHEKTKKHLEALKYVKKE